MVLLISEQKDCHYSLVEAVSDFSTQRMVEEEREAMGSVMPISQL
jgi:hypothetical protein